MPHVPTPRRGKVRESTGSGAGDRLPGIPAQTDSIWLDATASSREVFQQVVESLRDRVGATRGVLILREGGGAGDARLVWPGPGEAGDLPEGECGEILEGLRLRDDRFVHLPGRGIALPLRWRVRPVAEAAPAGRRRRFPARSPERLLGCLYFDGFPGGAPEKVADSPPDEALVRLLSVLLGETGTHASAALDPVTGLRPAVLLGRILQEELEFARGSGTPLALMLADVDGMRRHVLERGPREAEGILGAVGREIRRNLRRSDLGIRTGGQSFAILLPETDVEGAGVVAEKVRRSVERLGSAPGSVATLSLGFAAFPEQAEDARELCSRASRALARAKAGGRNRWTGWAPETGRGPRPDEARPAAALLADPKGRDLERLLGLYEYLERLAAEALPEDAILPELLTRVVLLTESSRGALLLPSTGKVVLRAGAPPDWPDPELVGETRAGGPAPRTLRAPPGLFRAWIPVTEPGEAGIVLERETTPFHSLPLQICAILARATPGIASALPVADGAAGTGLAHGFPGLIGDSPAMQKVYDLMRRVARSRMHVLLVGETGTGKELIARAIHRCSDRAAGPFITVDCGALAPSLAESELFGHRKGSFTDAREDRIGLFERAQGGTLFLDEIAGIPVELQTRLLRVLQEGEIRRVGEAEYRPVDVRVIAASNRDLRLEVAAGRMREDLYYRLNGVMILVPPLRERREDVPHLVSWFLRKHAGQAGTRPLRLDAAAFEALLGYAWPGNVRELENLVGKACLLAEGEVISRIHLPEEVVRASVRGPAPVPRTNAEFKKAKDEIVRDLTRRFLLQALHDHGGNVSRAASATGVQRTFIHRMLRELGIDPVAFKSPPADGAVPRAGNQDA